MRVLLVYQDRLGRLGRKGLHEAVVRVRQIEGHEMRLARHASNHHHGFAEVRLRLTRRMAQRLRGQAKTANPIDSKLAFPILPISTAHRIVLFEKVLSIHVAKHHRLSNEELLRPHTKV